MMMLVMMIMMPVTMLVDIGEYGNDLSDGGGLHVDDCGNMILMMLTTTMPIDAFLTIMLSMVVKLMRMMLMVYYVITCP